MLKKQNHQLFEPKTSRSRSVHMLMEAPRDTYKSKHQAFKRQELRTFPRRISVGSVPLKQWRSALKTQTFGIKKESIFKAGGTLNQSSENPCLYVECEIADSRKMILSAQLS